MKQEHAAWQRHAYPEGTRYENPMFPRREEARRRTTRRVRLALLLSCCVLLAGGAAFAFTAPFQLRYVSTEGVRYQQPGAVERSMAGYLNQRYLGLLPKSSYLLFSTARAERYLRTQLPAAQAIAALRVAKRFPSLVHVVVEERTPNLVYVNGGTSYLMDRQGYIAQLPETPKTKKGKGIDPSFPTLHDQNSRAVTVGAQMIQTQTVEFLFAARDALAATDIPIDVWYLPTVLCLPDPEIERRTNTNATKGANTNTAATNAPSAANTSAKAANTNDTNAAQQGSVATNAAPVCDTAERAKFSRELRVRTGEGWDIYFRTDDDAASQVLRVQQVLAAQHLVRKQLRYLDVRFGDRVNYR